jgi:hypothetical protein
MRFLIVLIVLLICALVFIYAMQITSVIVLAEEAMRARAQYAIGSDAITQSEGYLSRFFSVEYLNSGDMQALRTTYDGITVASYIQLASTQWVWTWPWGGTAYVRVHDKVNSIMGDVIDITREAEGIPAWQNGVYTLTLKNQKGVWRVVKLELVSLDPVPTATPVTTP